MVDAHITVYCQIYDIPIAESMMGELHGSVWANRRNPYFQTVTSSSFEEAALADGNKKFDNRTPRHVSLCLPFPSLT
jgi:hypothetical protein